MAIDVLPRPEPQVFVITLRNAAGLDVPVATCDPDQRVLQATIEALKTRYLGDADWTTHLTLYSEVPHYGELD